MYKFPGEDATLVTKNEVPIFIEPIPKIGCLVTCTIQKCHPYSLNLSITHVDGHETKIKYKAILKLSDYRASIPEKQYLDDFFERGDVIDALLLSYGDGNGCYVSTLSENLGIVKNMT